MHRNHLNDNKLHQDLPGSERDRPNRHSGGDRTAESFPAPCLVDTIHGRARRLDVSEITVRRRIKRGDIRAARIGGAWRILAPEKGSPSLLPEVCSVRQVANSLDVSELTVQRLIRSGRLNAFKAGQRWWIPRSVMVALLSEPIRGMSNAGPSRAMCASTGNG